MQISPKYCIVYASLSAVAFALKCKAAHFSTVHGKDIIKWLPLAATYLCRNAAKARFDNRPPPRWGFPKGRGRTPSPFGRFKEEGFSRGKGNRNPFPLEWRFWLLLSLLTKVTRRRQKEKGRKESNPPEATEKNPKAARCSHRAAHEQILYSSASFQPSTSAAAIRRPRRGRSNSPS